MRVLLLISVLLLAGCQPWTLNKSTEVTVDAILVLSTEVDTAERRGWISNATEDDLQGDLINALRVLRGAYTATDVAGCDGLADQECIQKILLKVEMELREAEG